MAPKACSIRYHSQTTELSIDGAHSVIHLLSIAKLRLLSD